MKVVKVKSKKTYINKNTQKECHYYNYFIENDNGKRIQIDAHFSEDYGKLDMIAEFRG